MQNVNAVAARPERPPGTENSAVYARAKACQTIDTLLLMRRLQLGR